MKISPSHALLALTWALSRAAGECFQRATLVGNCMHCTAQPVQLLSLPVGDLSRLCRPVILQLRSDFSSGFKKLKPGVLTSNTVLCNLLQVGSSSGPAYRR